MTRSQRTGSTAHLSSPLCDLTFEQSGDWYDPEPGARERDPDWTYTDRAGHSHTARLGETLDEVREPCYCSAVCEPHTVHKRWQCKRCGEHIVPGSRPARGFWTSEQVVVTAMLRTFTGERGVRETTYKMWVPRDDVAELYNLARSLQHDPAVLAETFGALIYLAPVSSITETSWSG